VVEVVLSLQVLLERAVLEAAVMEMVAVAQPEQERRVVQILVVEEVV